jgi:hypothetical protein
MGLCSALAASNQAFFAIKPVPERPPVSHQRQNNVQDQGSRRYIPHLRHYKKILI